MNKQSLRSLVFSVLEQKHKIVLLLPNSIFFLLANKLKDSMTTNSLDKIMLKKNCSRRPQNIAIIYGLE